MLLMVDPSHDKSWVVLWPMGPPALMLVMKKKYIAQVAVNPASEVIV